MTIGIGVLASTHPKPHFPRPDALILVADTMGSTATDSMDELHKLYFNDAAKMHVTCAGRVEMAAELVPMFTGNVGALSRKTHGTIWEALNIAVHNHQVQHFMFDVLAPRHSFLRPDMAAGALPVLPSDEAAILQEWENYDTGVELIVGTFDQAGQALLYLIGRQYDSSNALIPGMVHLRAYPGHVTIGTGGDNASFWLNYRQHTLARSIRQSAYHAYEAKIMAAKAPTVNDNIEIVIATAERSWYLTKEQPEQEGCDVSLLELEQMFKKYGPQNTYDLGFITKAPTSRKSAVK
jgi:hypothetical protein